VGQLFGLIAMEMARVDTSIATFFGVHNGLAMGSSIWAGLEEPKAKMAPADGPLGKNWLLRLDRASRRLGNIWRPYDYGQA